MAAIKAHLITIGDELLFGQTIDSNSAYIASKLGELGIEIIEISSISDNKNHIISTLNRVKKTADIIITTGGLGPTKDDITKKTLAQFFKVELIENLEVLQHIEHLFSDILKIEINNLNRSQALIPKGSIPLKNKTGTAPGMWIERDRIIYISLPGVPFEMKTLLDDEVIPKLKSQFHFPYILHRNILVAGIPESVLALKLESVENSLPKNIKLAYLPTGKRIRLRLTGKGENKNSLEKKLNLFVQQIVETIPKFVYSIKDESIEKLIGNILTEKHLKLAVAESFTSGRLASRITEIPGSSNYFLGGVVSYNKQIKQSVLNVRQSDIQQHSTVSEEVAVAMAKGVKSLMNVDISVATTGVSGPGEDEFGNPEGTAWVAIVSSEKIVTKKYYYPHIPRNDFADLIARVAVEKLYRFLLD